MGAGGKKFQQRDSGAGWRVFAGDAEGVVDGLGGAALAGFDGLVGEDAPEVAAALDEGHGLPATRGEGLALEGGAEDGRGLLLALHDEKQALDHLEGALLAAFGRFGLGDPVADLAAGGGAEGLEPAGEGALAFEGGGELGGVLVGAGLEVGLDADGDEVAGVGFGAGLHLFVDEEGEKVAVGAGEERGAEGEAVDGAADAASGPAGPGAAEGSDDLGGDAGDGPVEGLAGGFEASLKGLGFGRHGDEISMGRVGCGGKGECWVLQGEKTGAGGAEVSQVSEARPGAPNTSRPSGARTGHPQTE